MYGAADLALAQRGNHPLDMAPMAVAHDVVGIATALGTNSGLEPSVIAILLEQGRSIGQRAAA